MKQTKHAVRQGRLRAIRNIISETVLKYGSARRKPGNVTEYRMLAQDIAELPLSLRKDSSFIERMLRVAVVVDENNGYVITVYHLIGRGRFSKKYCPHKRGYKQKNMTAGMLELEDAA